MNELDISWQSQVLEKLDAHIYESGSLFSAQDPFPHAVIDNIFPEQLIDSLLLEFPAADDPMWERSTEAGIQVKLRSNWKSELEIQPVTRSVVHFFNSGSFMTRMSELTSVPRLISDPYFTGGGLNCILPGGVLDVHADGNWHDSMGVHRRLNAILYLNRNWDEKWGGHFELWDRELTAAVKKISPISNRLLIFETHDFTYHGHPTPLQCPANRSRKSMIFYYYTSSQRPPDQVREQEPHRALWRRRSLKSL